MITVNAGDLVLSCDGGDLRIKAGHTEQYLADPDNPEHFELVQACTDRAMRIDDLGNLVLEDVIVAMRGLASEDGWATGIPDEFTVDGKADYCPHHVHWADARLGLTDPDARTLTVNPEGWIPAWME